MGASWNNDPGSFEPNDTGCSTCSDGQGACCRMPENYTQWETQFMTYFSCALPMMYEVGINMSNVGVYGNDESADAYANMSNDLLYLYVYVTLLMFQREEDAAANVDCGLDKGNAYYYENWHINCLEKSFQCKGFDITGLLTAQSCDCDDDDIISTTPCDVMLPEPVPSFPTVGCAENFVPANLSQDEESHIVLSWDFVYGATCYDVFLGTSAFNLILVSSCQIENTYTSPTPYDLGTTYFWSIVPNNAWGPPANPCPLNSFSIIPEEPCQSPISWLTDQIMNDPNPNKGQVFDLFLSEGIVFNNASDIVCCPIVCNNELNGSWYVLCSGTMWTTSGPSLPTSPLGCYMDFYGDQRATSIFTANLGFTYNALNPIPGTSFDDGIASWKIFAGSTCINDYYISQGIVEAGSFDPASSQLIEIQNMLTLIYPGLTTGQYCFIIQNLLSKAGLAFYCQDNIFYAGGFPTVLTLLNT